MQAVLLQIHSIFRWVVLLAALVAIVLAALSVSGSRPWDAITERASRIYPVTMDIQLLVGILLWVVEGRWAGDAFLGYIHPLIMFGAVGAAHVGRSRADKQGDTKARGRAASILFAVSLVLVILAIPTNRWGLR